MAISSPLSRSCGGGWGGGKPRAPPLEFAPFSITPRPGDGVQPDIAEHMRHEFEPLEYLFKRRVADAQAAGIGAERRHHGALAVAGKTAPLHRSAARRHPRLGMQMAGDFTGCSRRLVAKSD